MKFSPENMTYPSMSQTLILSGCDSNVPGDLIKAERFVRYIILTFIGSALIALCAQINILLYPVPVSMQTFAVFLIGLTYGWRFGGITITLYLLKGAFGLPVFAKGGFGIAVLAGPTAGFLFGFFFIALSLICFKATSVLSVPEDIKKHFKSRLETFWAPLENILKRFENIKKITLKSF